MSSTKVKKSDLVHELTKVVEIDQKKAVTIIDEIFKEISGSLMEGKKVSIRNFGSFEVKKIRRAYYNINKGETGEEVLTKKIKFTPSHNLNLAIKI